MHRGVTAGIAVVAHQCRVNGFTLDAGCVPFGDLVAPLCRNFCGAFMPELKWLLYAGISQPWNRWPDWSGLGGHFGLEYAHWGGESRKWSKTGRMVDWRSPQVSARTPECLRDSAKKMPNGEPLGINFWWGGGNRIPRQEACKYWVLSNSIFAVTPKVTPKFQRCSIPYLPRS